jgi:hypothetical protein
MNKNAEGALEARPRRRSRRYLVMLVAAVGGLLTVPMVTAAAATPGATMTGEAYGLTASVGLLGQPPSTLINRVPDTGLVVTKDTTTVNPACVEVPDVLLVVHALCTSVNTHANTSRVTAAATLADLKIVVPGLPAIELRGVKGWSSVTCGSSHGTTTVAFLKVGTQSVISRRATFSNGKSLTVGPLTIVFNQVVRHGPPDRTRLVNAVHITANVPHVAYLDVIVSSALAGVADCAS